jgi:enoyl-CoA hydratase
LQNGLLNLKDDKMTDEVLFTQEGQLGLITLNRPRALNALTFTMILAMQKQLSLWKVDESIEAVVIQATPGKAFCAGGDVLSLYSSEYSEQMRFFWHEYRLNHFIHHFGKPYISFIDGIVMGGGVGISLHGSHPIGSERFVFAMPETSIGFFPDIGASHLLTRCPDSLGVYLGLTGDRVGPHEALQAKLIKAVIASESMPTLLNTLKQTDLSSNAYSAVDACLREYILEPEPIPIKPEISQCFVQPTIEKIKAALEEQGGELPQKSPLSLKVTLALLQRAKGLSLAECLQMDYKLVGHFMEGKDFYEGVRALLVDKDKNPRWNPESLEMISNGMVEDYFVCTGNALEF